MFSPFWCSRIFNYLRKAHSYLNYYFDSMPLHDNSEFIGKTFQAAQLTHEIFDVTYSTTHQRVEVQFGRYQKNILQE